MMKSMFASFRLFVCLTVITGIIYPLMIYLVGRSFFPAKIGGSLIRVGGEVVGSELIGQKFADPKYFWPRPSAVDYNPLPSGATNFGPTSDKLKSAYFNRKRDDGALGDLLFASGSGLDPHMSVDAAKHQVPRIASQRKLAPDRIIIVYNLIGEMTEGRTFGFLGEERVNALKLNMALDRMCSAYEK